MKRSYLLILILCLLSVATSAQQATDKPRDGEGVHAFLKRNKCNSSAQYKEFLELNKGKFGRNNALLKGVSYKLPGVQTTNNPTKEKDKPTPNTPQTASGNKQINELFGKKHQEYTIKSSRLKGACFFLSSGHGGPDPGAIGKVDGHSLHEDEYAYDITLRLAKALLEEGATVHMIIQDAKDGIRDNRFLANSKRETCMGKAIPLNQLQRLKQRADKINELANQSKEKYKRCLFVHLDSRGHRKQLDVFFYYGPKSTAGKKLANTMSRTFKEQYAKHQPNRGFSGTVSMRELYMLKNTTPVGLYAELGNIQNASDQKRFLDPNNRQALANWMLRGFIKDFENWKAGSN